MNNLNLTKTVLLVSLALSAGTLTAQNLSGDEVMAKAYRAAKPQTSVITMSMVISKNKQSLSRTFTMYATGDNARGEVQKSVMKFLSPADVKGSGFLSIKKVDGSTESLLWLPAMGKVRRLSSGGSDQDSAFFGSDFTNRDITGFIEADFTYQLLGFEAGLYIVEAKPKKAVGYERLVYHVEAAEFTETKVDYYKAGRLLKSKAVTTAKVQGYNQPSTIVMTSVSGSTTVLQLTDHKLDTSFGDQMFTERFLKQ